MKNLYYFLTECLFFGKPKEGSIIPNWVLAIFAWSNIAMLSLMAIKIIHKIFF
jgi:hypothetical protein